MPCVTRSACIRHEAECETELFINRCMKVGADNVVVTYPCTGLSVVRAVRYIHNIKKRDGLAKLPDIQPDRLSWGGRGIAPVYATWVDKVHAVATLATEVPFESCVTSSLSSGNSQVATALMTQQLMAHVDVDKEQIVFATDALLMIISKKRLQQQRTTHMGLVK